MTHVTSSFEHKSVQCYVVASYVLIIIIMLPIKP
jgi:hypothetical protein